MHGNLDYRPYLPCITYLRSVYTLRGFRVGLSVRPPSCVFEQYTHQHVVSHPFSVHGCQVKGFLSKQKILLNTKKRSNVMYNVSHPLWAHKRPHTGRKRMDLSVSGPRVTGQKWYNFGSKVVQLTSHTSHTNRAHQDHITLHIMLHRTHQDHIMYICTSSSHHVSQRDVNSM